MQKAFETKVSLIDPTLQLTNKLTSDVIFQFLNEYTQRYVKQVYLQRDNLQSDTRAHKGNVDSIKSLITRKQLFNQTDTHNTDKYSRQYLLPNDYFLYIRSNSLVTSTYLNQKYDDLESIPNEMISTEDAEKVITTPYNRVILRNPQVTMITSDKQMCMNVIHDAFTKIDSVDLIYYRLPKPFNVLNVDGKNILDHCELPESVHNEIVEGAVEMFVTEAKFRLNVKQSDK